jgi:uncharacterized protein YdaL
MANLIYNSVTLEIQKQVINLETDTIKMMLVTSAYVPNVDTHSKRSHITGEISGGGYPAGGIVLDNKTLTQDNDINKTIWDADDVTFTGIALDDCAGCVLYKSRGGAASADELITYLGFPEPVTMTSGIFIVPFSVNGILTLGQNI